jgi:hypothetical protein
VSRIVAWRYLASDVSNLACSTRYHNRFFVKALSSSRPGVYNSRPQNVLVARGQIVNFMSAVTITQFCRTLDIDLRFSLMRPENQSTLRLMSVISGSSGLLGSE